MDLFNNTKGVDIVMSKNTHVEIEKVFKPIKGSNTLVCEETGEVKYLSVMVWDIEKDYTEFIVE